MSVPGPVRRHVQLSGHALYRPPVALLCSTTLLRELASEYCCRAGSYSTPPAVPARKFSRVRARPLKAGGIPDLSARHPDTPAPALRSERQASLQIGMDD
eukprot:1157797-Pelagomonas_calceolata.AAC.3